MNVVKGAIPALLPALLVAMRFLIPGDWNNGNTWGFTVFGFAATFLGCAGAVVVFRQRLPRVPVSVVVVGAVVVAIILLILFPAILKLPFAGLGYVFVWAIAAAVLTSALIVAASTRYA